MFVFLIAALLQAAPKEEAAFFKRWLTEDAAYIISKEESAAAKLLKTPEEQDAFIAQFWLRRDPTPGTAENEAKDEHYRRIAYANQHFTTATDGWRTDRGKMYIRFGKPDNIDSSSQTAHTTMVSGARRWTVPYEIWDYRGIPGIGPVKLTFVDRTMSGYYELTLNPEDKIAKFSTEDNSVYAGSFNNTTAIGETPDSDVFTRRLQQYAAVMRPPEIRFKDLQEIVNVRLNFNAVAYDVRYDVLKGLGDKGLVPITFAFSGSGNVNVYGAVVSISGRVVAEFEDAVALINGQHYQRFLTLDPGRYRMTTVVKDPGTGNAGTKELLITVPRPAPRLSSSSLILADLLAPAPPDATPLDNFVISRYRVRPLVSESIAKKTPLGLYLELYGFATDTETKQPQIEGDLRISPKGLPNEGIVLPIGLEDFAARYNERLIFARSLDIQDFAPGEYLVRFQVTDKLKKDTLTVERSLRIR